MVPVDRRMLFTDRRRALLGVLGVAVALVMALALEGIFAGSTGQVSRYVETSPADVFVSQQGVRTIHMSISVLSADTADRVGELPGVEWVEPILFASDAVAGPEGRRATYVFGYQPGGLGGPRTIIEGGEPGPGELVADDSAATALGITVGDEVEILGRPWRVSGLTTGMTSIVNTTVYVRFDDLTQVLGRGDSVSYLLVGTAGDSQAVAEQIEAAVPGVEAQTRPLFSAEERSLVREMSTDLMNIMSVAALIVATAVIGLVLYATILARLRDIGIMKALGLTPRAMTRLVLTQAGWTVATALLLAVAITYALGSVVTAVAPDIDLVVEPASLARAGIAAAVVGAIGAIAPLRRVLKIDPATVFRRPT